MTSLASNYWLVGNKGAVVFSSPASAYVATSDAGYVAFRAAGNLPSVILCDGELAHVFWLAGQNALARAAGATSLGGQGGMPPADAVELLATLGLTLTSSGNSALDGTYALDQATRANIMAEQVAVNTSAKFTNGTTTKNWPDATGTLHAFDPAHWTPFAEAAGAYYDALFTWAPSFAANPETAPPSSSATIA